MKKMMNYSCRFILWIVVLVLVVTLFSKSNDHQTSFDDISFSGRSDTAFIRFSSSSSATTASSASSSFSPIFFPINDTIHFANVTTIESKKVFLVRTNRPISVILPPQTNQGAYQLQKVSKQVLRQPKQQQLCATVAINGGPFNWDGSCVGPVVSHNGHIVSNSTSSWPGFGRGYRMNNSNISNSLYVLGEYSDIPRDTHQQHGDGEHTIQLTDFVTGFGWLVYGGQIVVDHNNPTGAIQAPRTVIAVDKNNHWILLVADGCEKCPPPYHRGMTLLEVATVLINVGAKYAINLDGGSSTTMVDGSTSTTLNHPTCLDVLPIKCERPVASVICVN